MMNYFRIIVVTLPGCKKEITMLYANCWFFLNVHDSIVVKRQCNFDSLARIYYVFYNSVSLACNIIYKSKQLYEAKKRFFKI